MKFISFNVNGIRSRLHQLSAVIEQHLPDVIGLQETKVIDELFPVSEINQLGYEVLQHGQKGHYGVALLYRAPLNLESSMKGFPGEAADHQRRLVSGLFDYNGKKLRVINGYFPQGENRDHPDKFPNKQQFYANLADYLNDYCSADELLVVMGDMNVAPQDRDIGIGADNMKRWLRTGKCCFLPEEREWLDKLTSWGLVDSFRHDNPTVDDQFSWFDYRSRGFEREPKRGLRIDLILATPALMNYANGSGIDYSIRSMEKPSDHCPVWLEVNL